jgi:hypothetical protein
MFLCSSEGLTTRGLGGGIGAGRTMRRSMAVRCTASTLRLFAIPSAFTLGPRHLQREGHRKRGPAAALKGNGAPELFCEQAHELQP